MEGVALCGLLSFCVGMCVPLVRQDLVLHYLSILSIHHVIIYASFVRICCVRGCVVTKQTKQRKEKEGMTQSMNVVCAWEEQKREQASREETIYEALVCMCTPPSRRTNKPTTKKNGWGTKEREERKHARGDTRTNWGGRGRRRKRKKTKRSRSHATIQ